MTAAWMVVFVSLPGASFRVARTETTVAQFEAFVKATGYRTSAEQAGDPLTWRSPGFKVNRRQPVVFVSPADAMAFCKHAGGRLPTDAEWDYAAAAGAKTRHFWGEEIDGRYLWYRPNSGDRPRPVAKKLPNAWGLYDVQGNVWEWSVDGEMANRRGGSFMSCDEGDRPRLMGLRVYFKVPVKTAVRRDDIGFRCVCATEPGPGPRYSPGR